MPPWSRVAIAAGVLIGGIVFLQLLSRGEAIPRRRPLKRFRMSVIATAVLLLLCRISAHANLITNGSFETPAVPASSFQLFSTGGSFTGWSVVGASGNVGIVSGTFAQNGFSFPAEDGSQWLDLTGISKSATGVQQTVATTSGTMYDLSFFVGNVVDPGGIFGTTSTVDVLVNGTLILSATNSQGGTTLTWKQFGQVFTATSSSTTIEFLNGDPPSDDSNGLDNIVLTAVVPEPSTWLMFGTGIVGLLGYGWRRRKQVVKKRGLSSKNPVSCRLSPRLTL